MNAATILFDTLAYSKKLKAAGVPEPQAEAHAEALAETIENKLATKSDLKALETHLTHYINKSIGDLRFKLTLRMGSMMIAMIAILATIIKL